MSELNKNLNVAVSPVMLDDMRRMARELKLTAPQTARLAFSLLIKHGVSYATPPTQEPQRETTAAD